ncbi:Concanavalin A-like lectin/glucanases superfamily protein [Actinopolyspora lacussalsi subsp. righensis]|uniref:Concanavalin A-like lectin/glucanases superfamily protein n=1 Tax=Actinopolyspora righensis TaxID=995060 RepID=A0A1I6XEX3_9ACTN|nr:LamG-like jellyroll fold domain-containing protein [Actinopolyspora righensis]SFT36562.1 Concanavalin A-like lectin/glucanases superfamily protein [Actinopolyspora righensis]
MDTDSEHRDVTRRGLFRAAAGTSVAIAASSATSIGASADSRNSWHSHSDADTRFTLAVMPDTQYLIDEGGSDPEPVREGLRWVAENRRKQNIAFLAHLGDVSEHGTEREMRIADRAFRGIGHRMPYSVLGGNHDVSGDDQRGDTPYLRTFGPDRFNRMDTYGGSSPDGYNSYHVFEGGGRRWLLLALDWRVSDRGVRWTQGVLNEHPELPTILTTHDLVWAEDDGMAHLSDHGQWLWEGLIRGNDQIFLAIGGHYWPCGRTTLTNDAGNTVHLHLANYQERYYGGAGMIRLYSFDPVRGMIDVATFSPWLREQHAARRSPLEAENVELTTNADRFGVEIDFEGRFAGFAPPTSSPERSASEVVHRDTVAYWRFDRSGFVAGNDGAPVAAGAVARDLSGNGNDLIVERLHGGPPELLTFSSEHHDAAPAHASLRFDGGQDPNRGAVLRAKRDSPINSAGFTRGYTIETFLKLPEPFRGSHAWMGILGWEGRAGDAGKDGGYSTDDAPCGLALSGERFLQHVVYPHNRDDDPTCWSHALPVGQWVHVAVVNDGRHTTVYVDRSKIARNAAARSKGITTLGEPFALGAKQSAGRYGQGFHGSLGDTRITARALRPEEFLSAVSSDSGRER